MELSFWRQFTDFIVACPKCKISQVSLFFLFFFFLIPHFLYSLILSGINIIFNPGDLCITTVSNFSLQLLGPDSKFGLYNFNLLEQNGCFGC